MSLSGTTFKWLDILESEFDRAYVELNGILFHPEAEIEYVIGPAQQKMADICAAFTQLSEKAQSIFQNNAKLEAQICNLRRDLVESQAQKDCIEQEHRNLLFEVHKAQLENVKDRPEGQSILLSLMHRRGEDTATVSLDEARLHREVVQLKKENLQLREGMIDQQSELYSSHLACRYLDKELAGRIQQIQLLARDARAFEHNQLWNQLEAEIGLQRHKTIIQACRSRSRRKVKGNRPKAQDDVSLSNSPSYLDIRPAVERAPCPSNMDNVVGVVRQVEIYKERGVNIGLAVTGGQDYGVPILISEIKPGHLAESSGKFIIGDAVLSVNGVDLQKAKHDEAVDILSRLDGNVVFELLYIQPDEDEEDDGSVQDLRVHRDDSGTTDSLRALSAHSEDSNSATSRVSRLERRRPRFPGHALDVTGQRVGPDPVSSFPEIQESSSI